MNYSLLFDIIRGKPINKDWDLTFLITFWHLEYKKPSIYINDNDNDIDDINGDQVSIYNHESKCEQRLYDPPCFDRLQLKYDIDLPCSITTVQFLVCNISCNH